ncbi:MAG: protein kinase domain-containing protein, partial [Allorhizobium sp.]
MALYYLLEYTVTELWLRLQWRGRLVGLPDAQARFYAGQLAAALQHMHAHGFVHRDVKPENVMLDASGRVRLIDFGTAKNLRQHQRNGPEF